MIQRRFEGKGPTSPTARAAILAVEASPLARLGHDPRRAVREDSIVCLICGRPLRQITSSHLRGHDVTPESYKQRFGYNARWPLMCLALRRLYSERSRFEVRARRGRARISPLAD
jgi:predicted transcriptional regulator